MPPFYFKIEIMRAHPHVRQRVNHNGRWLPPKVHGHNIKWNQPGVTTPVYYHNGHMTQRVDELPEDAEEYKVHSIYHDQAVFWAVDFDATEEAVENGRDFDSASGGEPHNEDEQEPSSDSDDDKTDDWRPLSFRQMNHKLLSYVGRRLPSRTLLVQRPDQRWVGQLLPHTYQAPPERRTQDQTYGGLVGELPLLIGLAAMSLPLTGQYSVHTMLPHMIVNPSADDGVIGSWRVFPDHVQQGAGWSQKRGFVITVYHDPDEDIETSEAELKTYERGGFGPIFA